MVKVGNWFGREICGQPDGSQHEGFETFASSDIGSHLPKVQNLWVQDRPDLPSEHEKCAASSRTDEQKSENSPQPSFRPLLRPLPRLHEFFQTAL
jgi:hypothetical protein